MSPQDLRNKVRDLVVQAQASVAARPSINPSDDGEVWDMAARLLVASGGAEAVDVHIGADGMPKIPSAQTLSSIYSAAFSSSASVNINSAIDRGFDAVANTVAAPFRSELCEARARIAALESALARCRDAFDIPEPGDGAEEDWVSAIGMADCVPDFVERSVKLMKADHQRLLDKHNALHASAAQCRQQLAAMVPDDDTIRSVFMAHGFTIKDGQTDLKPYVFAAARALFSAAPAQPEPAAQGEPVGEIYRYGKDSHGREWHGIHWYDPNVDVPSGTKLFTATQRASKPMEPTPPADMNINQRVAYTLGWNHCLAAHKIGGEQ